MAAKGAERLVQVCKATLFEQMKPHLQVRHDEERLIETSRRQRSAEHHRARAADQIALLEKTSIDHRDACDRPLLLEARPRLDGLRFLIHDPAR